ncbi:MAG: TolC family protein [Synergistaceae bacterium]|nr:TolC family protein [Synergistaceae bacterium]
MRNKIIAALCLIQILFAGAAAAETLTLGSCVRTALENHPDMVAAESKVASKKAAVGQSAADSRPQIKGGASYTRSDSTESVNDSGKYNASISLEQSIYDWGKRGLKIEGAKLNMDAAEAEYLDTRDKIILGVKSAYYNLNRSIRQYEVAKTRYDNYQKRLLWAKSYYEVGTKPKIEVTKAEADLANSKLTLVRVGSAAEQYRAQLASSMGIPMMDIKNVADVLSYEEWSVPIEQAVERAVLNRPYLASQRKRVEYTETLLALEKKGLSPEISASAGYNAYGSAPFDDNGWNARLSLNIPLYDGGLTKSRVEGAEAELVTAKAQLQSASNEVMLEVRKAWHALAEAGEALNASLEAERQARETYELAEGRYEAGVGSSLEISDAVESYALAQTNTILSLYECKAKRLDLEKAMGGLEE